MNNFSPQTCLQCGKSLTGRSDKKFCDAYCRNSFNNQHKAEDELYMQRLNSKLRKNRRILKTLCPEGKATIRKEVLDHMGYDFLFFTGLYKSPKSSLIYYLVYDYGFSAIFEKGIEKAVIINRQSYMDKPSYEIWRKDLKTEPNN